MAGVLDSIPVILGLIGITTFVSGLVTWWYRRAYVKGSNAATDHSIHEMLNKDMITLGKKIDDVEGRVISTLKACSELDCKAREEFKKEFDAHVEDDEQNFAKVHERIDQAHVRIDSVSDDTSYIRGQIDIFLKKKSPDV